MMKLFLACTAALLAATVANAAPIPANSDLNIVGSSNFSISGVRVVDYINPASTLLNAGAFSAFDDCLGCVDMTTPWDYAPASLPDVVYTETDGALTTSFVATGTILVDLVSPTILDLEYSGYATLTGYDNTAGDLTLTLNQGTHNLVGSFSATAQPVLEPASLLILGVGLIGLAVVRRRKVSPA
jgi:hypothetical protein